MRCGSCGAPVTWAKTAAGKVIPLDPEPVANGNVLLRDGVAIVFGAKSGAPPAGERRYKSHFATCAQAAQHRRPR